MNRKDFSKENQFWKRVTEATALKELSETERNISTTIEPEYSEDFMNAMEGIIKNLNEEHNRTHASRTMKRTFLCVAIISMLIFALAATGSALKINFFEIFSDQTPSHTDINFATSHTLPQNWDYIYIATDLPSGYSQIDYSIFTDFSATLVYGDPNNPSAPTINIYQYISPPDIFSFDTENASSKSVTVMGADGICYSKDGLISIHWNNSSHYFILTTALDESTALRIADSLQKEN